MSIRGSTTAHFSLDVVVKELHVLAFSIKMKKIYQEMRATRASSRSQNKRSRSASIAVLSKGDHSHFRVFVLLVPDGT